MGIFWFATNQLAGSVISRLRVGEIEQLNRMSHTNGELLGPESRTNLYEASGIGGQDQLWSWVGGSQPGHFLLERGPPQARPQDRIDTGGAAAPIRSGQQLQPETWDCAEHLQWSFMHPLRVLQVARRIVGDIETERSTWPRASFGEQLGDVAHRDAKSSRLFPSQEMSVVLE